MRHISVLTTEAIEALNLKDDSIVVDCTLGGGGHAKAILELLGSRGIYIGIDRDETAIKNNHDLKESARAKVHLISGDFADIRSILDSLGIDAVDAILADLGWRTDQFDGSGEAKGFSFLRDEPLLMTYGLPEEYELTARDIVNEWSEEDIANVLFGYGEERYARRIAKVIVETRLKTPIESSKALADLIVSAVPMGYRKGKTHPATKSFQALRIAVNDEQKSLEKLLTDGFEALKPKGRMAIISFHSLEDRMIKEAFKEHVSTQTGTLIHKKPIVASREELQDNPRARSAKLRTIEKN